MKRIGPSVVRPLSTRSTSISTMVPVSVNSGKKPGKERSTVSLTR